MNEATTETTTTININELEGLANDLGEARRKLNALAFLLRQSHEPEAMAEAALAAQAVEHLNRIHVELQALNVPGSQVWW